ncbi:armadillo repeat-containing protein 2-like isoform X2 [Oscarella lobularis]|uniref:armadillo repeat-containing protein 2-like isoform X2 n=1 Tax=Oscarella lobularis TaxID=121494 RepID=UPI0033140EA8
MTDKRRSSRRNDRTPFYETPRERRSTQIIAETHQSIRTLETSRPYTPANAHRTLLTGAKSTSSRPPSVYSIGQRQFVDDLSRPESSSSSSGLPMPPPRLAPIKSSSSDVTMATTTSDLVVVGAGNGTLQPRPPPGTKPTYRRGAASGGRTRRKPVAEIAEEDGGGARRALSAGSAGAAPSPLPKPPAPTVTRSPKIQRSSRIDGVNVTAMFDERVQPLLDFVDPRADRGRLYEVVDRLYGALEEAGMLGRGAGKKRWTVLKTIFKLLDVADDRLLVKVSRLILALDVSGNNLMNVCKLLFKLSKTESNDLVFREEGLCANLLTVVKTANPIKYCEALIYCIGTLKLLSGNSLLQRELADLKAIQTLAKLMANINEIKSGDEGKNLSAYTVHLLVQVTATLRNLADVGSRKEQFVSSGAIESLCPLMTFFKHDVDLMLNVSRILSKLTQQSACKAALSQIPTAFKSMLNLLSFHIANQDLVVRLCFVLGNLTVRDDAIRTAIFFDCQGMDVLMNVFRTYAKLDEQNDDDQSVASPTTEGQSKSEAVLVKLIRVIANLSVHPDVGSVIACSEPCVELLMQILANKEASVAEELVLNTIATINNLSYYNISESIIVAKQDFITELLANVLLNDNMEIMAETFRVFGNLSRSKEVRAILANKKVDRMMITVLDSGRRDVVYAACGVLVNMMADVEHWKTLRDERGPEKLTDVLRDFGRADWQLAALVGKILSNYCREMTSSSEWLGENEAINLMNLLSDLLDEKTALTVVENDLPDQTLDFVRQSWQDDFCPVARKLLAEIEASYSELEPL